MELSLSRIAQEALQFEGAGQALPPHKTSSRPQQTSVGASNRTGNKTKTPCRETPAVNLTARKPSSSATLTWARPGWTKVFSRDPV